MSLGKVSRSFKSLRRERGINRCCCSLVISNPNPTITMTLLLAVLDYLISGAPAWDASSIHLFGFAQGGSCAAELAIAFSRRQTTLASSQTSSPISTSKSTSTSDIHLGSLTTISGALISHPTLTTKSCTKTLVVRRKNEERMMSLGSFRKGFEVVEEVVLPRGEGMLRSRDEWEGVMKCVLSFYVTPPPSVLISTTTFSLIAVFSHDSIY